MTPFRKQALALLATAALLGIVLSKPASDTNEASSSPKSTKKRIVNVALGQHCSLGAAPVGPNGSWQIVETDVQKVCEEGTSCRKGACNCDDLKDGTVTGQSVDSAGERSCKRVAGQKCSMDGDCFQDVQCKEGVCTCDKSKKDFYCVDKKNDIYILA